MSEYTDQQIIIVRRGGEDEDEHHGGAWKIAFADFMTAMMALFLVLWLINAADEETRQSVASYFNPVKLTDNEHTVKGLEDSDGATQGKETEVTIDSKDTQSEEDEEDDASSEPGPTNSSILEKEFFADPLQKLDELAVEVTMASGGTDGTDDKGSRVDGEFDDPFAPNFWQSRTIAAESSDNIVSGKAPAVQMEAAKDETRALEAQLQATFGAAGTDGLDAPSPFAAKDAEDRDETSEETTDQLAADEREIAKNDVDEPSQDLDYKHVSALPPMPAEADAPATDAEESSAEVALASASPEDVAAGERERQREATARSIAADIEEAMASTKGGRAVTVDVQPAEGGVLVSLTEGLDEPMFELGSAVPRGGAVVALETIAKVLDGREGSIHIEGHTDGRPLDGKNGNDNWRLSLDRARAVYFMLVRGGMSEDRFGGLSGYADRRLKIADDPYDGRNRRIEILLQGS